MQQVIEALADCGKRVEFLKEHESSVLRRFAMELVLQDLLKTVERVLDMERHTK